MRLWIAALTGCFLLGPNARADLPGYVDKPDSAFQWDLRGKADSPLGTVYDLHVVSQIWEGITWEHGVQVHVPLGVIP